MRGTIKEIDGVDVSIIVTQSRETLGGPEDRFGRFWEEKNPWYGVG